MHLNSLHQCSLSHMTVLRSLYSLTPFSAKHGQTTNFFPLLFVSLPPAEHSGQADQEDQPGTGGGNKLLERPVHGGHYSQCRYCKKTNIVFPALTLVGGTEMHWTLWSLIVSCHHYSHLSFFKTFLIFNI